MDDLSVQITGPNGAQVDFSTTSSDAESLVTVDRVTTKYGTGHESAQLTLHRDPLKRFDDIDLLYQVSITDSVGNQVFGGRVSGINPEAGRTQINCTGNWSIAKDKSGVPMIFKDRSLERWGGMSPTRKAALLTAGFAPDDGTSEGASLLLKIAQPVWTASSLPFTAMTYAAPVGCAISNVAASVLRTTADWNTGDGNYTAYAHLGTDDALSSSDDTSDFAASVGSAYALSLTSTTSDRRFVEINARYEAAYGTADSVERAVRFSSPVVTGTHGLTTVTPSTVVKWLIDNHCAGLTYDADSITDHTYEIPHMVMEETDVADGWARANAFANWAVNVWGNKVYYAPDPSLTEPDFILDIEQGDTLDPDGTTMDENKPINGVEVFYTDSLTGRKEKVGPDDDYRLRSDDPENPCNKMGVDRWGKLDISFPCAEDDAIQVGSVWFAEASTPDRVGSGSAVGTVTAKDGSKVPVSSIRSGHVVKYAHESIGRLVYATTYEPSSSKMEMKFDNAPATLSAVLERIGVAVMKVGGR